MRNRIPRYLTVALAALMLALPSLAQDPAKLAPPNTQVFIHIDQPDEWFAALADGPIGDKFRNTIENESEFGGLLALLGMDFDQFMNAYFGEEVVIIGPKANDDDGPGLIFTKVDQANREHLIASFELKRVGKIANSPLYVSDDGNGYFVMMDQWVAICDLVAVDYLHAVLEADPLAPTLADTEAYGYWVGLLPDDRAATALFLGDENNSHAFGITRSGKLLDMTYLGKSPDYAAITQMLGDADLASFGPLPADTLTAISFNLKADPDQPNELLAGLNLLTSPASFSDDILPKLGTPTLVFMGSVPGAEVGLNVDLPVAGMAVKMKDASAAADLQAMLDRVVLLGNMAMAEQNAGPIPFRTTAYQGVNMRIAEVGKLVAPLTDWPELEPMQLVYGTVGDYYVVCTQETFFRQCVDANAGGRELRIRDQGPAHDKATAPIMVMTGRPDGIGQMLRTWLPLIENGELPDELKPDFQAPGALGDFRELIGLLEQFSQFKLELWRGEDGMMIGRGQLIPPL